MEEIKKELSRVERDLLVAGNGENGLTSVDLANLRLVKEEYKENVGFSASGFFALNRGILTSLVGSLATYLIVLLQFKASDMSNEKGLFARSRF